MFADLGHFSSVSIKVGIHNFGNPKFRTEFLKNAILPFRYPNMLTSGIHVSGCLHIPSISLFNSCIYG